MSDEQKYSELLKELGEVLKEKNSELAYLRFKNSDLQNALKKAEEQLAKAEEKLNVFIQPVTEKIETY